MSENTLIPEAPADRLNELATLGELSAVLAHELRNPLSSIKGAAQILQHEWGPEHPQGEFLSIILDEVEALTALTTEFLDFARPMYPELSWADWNDMAASAVASIQTFALEADTSIVFEPCGPLPSVLMDRVQMERAVQNVVRNAIQASPHGSHVHVRTYRTSAGVSAEVMDHGAGVSPEHVSKIFTPFFTTKVTGTGLGLPMARKIAQCHGGDVTVHRNDGPGSTFVIHVPAPGDVPD